MGYWLLAQCDTYPPAASAAKDAFTAAFPPSKQPEAIAFCKDEIASVSPGNCYLLFLECLRDSKHITVTALLPGSMREYVREMFPMEGCLFRTVFNTVVHAAFYLLKIYILYLFILRHGGRKRGSETPMHEGYIDRLSHAPSWGPDLQPRRAPGPGILWPPFDLQASAQSTEPDQPGLMLFFNCS